MTRTFFEPDETEEFEAAADLLIRRCLAWAGERGLPADGVVLAAALESRHHSRDGRLAFWDREQVRRFLLLWMPHHVVAPQDVLDAAPESLRTLLRYLDASGLWDPRGAPVAELSDVVTAAEYAAALDDPLRQSVAKFWARIALDRGVDLDSRRAVEKFQRDIDAGRVPYDAEVLDQLMMARLAEPELDEERAYAQPPIALPPAAELAEAAARSVLVRRLAAVAEWAGADGRPLTAAGAPRRPDARELAALLETGEDDLLQLNLLLAWAKKARLIRTSKGRLFRVAKAAPILRDPETLWRRAFEAFFELGSTIGAPPTSWDSASMLVESFDEILPDVLNSMYGLPSPIPVVRLQESVWLACKEYFLVDGERSGEEVWRRQVDLDLVAALEALAALGAVELSRGAADELYSSDLDDEDQPLDPEAAARLLARLREPDLLLARLTPLGLRATRGRMLAEGRDAPLIGELATAPPAALLGLLAQHYPPEAAAVEVAGWLAVPGQDVEALLQGVRDCPFRTRATAMLGTMTEALTDGPSIIRGLRGDPILGPIALTALLDGEDLQPESLSDREQLLLLAEGLLNLLELGGAEAVLQEVTEMAGKDATEVIEAALSSGHPDVAGLKELGALLPQLTRAHHPLRLVPGNAPGSRGRRRGHGKKRKH
ncbi:hypothetical protein [Nonomuraea sp. NEAU-A123]|uniref:hypothetical protein n=1 Tax=Nonomuraea sp. NEAU-A123 TaxID=2839649 RepID=UPI001BE43916|nr:hypothetical protein [Nonomuraea sp. NEAU-A123]MBT2235038.1 hypothetical protein [Nonomuraea sp. NEAU-A123]